MAWIMDEFSKIKGVSSPAVVTGKPLVLGGSLGRVEATGRGVMVTARSAMARLKMDPSKATCAVQGFGNVGSMMCYKVGAEDAEKLEKEFAPNFSATDLVNMDKYK